MTCRLYAGVLLRAILIAVPIEQHSREIPAHQCVSIDEETTETAIYKIENGVLNYNGYDYVKCSADELS